MQKVRRRRRAKGIEEDFKTREAMFQGFPDGTRRVGVEVKKVEEKRRRKERRRERMRNRVRSPLITETRRGRRVRGISSREG